MPIIDLYPDPYLNVPIYSIDVTIDVVPTLEFGGYSALWLPRLLVNAVEVEVISWSAPSGGESAGATLEVTLHNINDHALFVKGAIINFGIGKKVADVWDEATFKTLLSNAAYRASKYDISGEPAEASDKVEVTSISGLLTKLDLRPTQSEIIYDSNRVSYSPEMFGTFKDNQGNSYTTTLDAVPGLNLVSLLNEVLVTRCGFTSVITDLPASPVTAAKIPLGTRYWDAIKPFMGPFSPIVYQDGNTIGILDSTKLHLPNFPPPPILTADSYSSLNVSEDLSSGVLTAFRIRFIHNIEDTDVVIGRDDLPVYEMEGTNRVKITRGWRDFSKNSTPGVIFRSEPDYETRETYTAAEVLIARSTERYTWTAENRMESRKQTLEAFYPDLDNWDKDVNNDGTNDDPLPEPPYLFGRVSAEDEYFEHDTYPVDALTGAPLRSYVRSRSLTQRGTILVNSDLKHLGQNFKQELIPGVRSGNVAAETTLLRDQLIKTRLELGVPTLDGTVSIATTVTDHLPVKPLPVTNYSQSRAGDASVKTFKSTEQVMLIRPTGAIGPIQAIEDFHFGELPIDEGIALAQRTVNMLLTSPKTLNFEFVGYSDSIRPGTLRTIHNRQGLSLGIYLILSVTPSGDSTGVGMSISGRKI